MLQRVGIDFLHCSIVGMSQMGKGKACSEISNLSGRPVISIDYEVEKYVGMTIKNYIPYLQEIEGLSAEEAWLKFKEVGNFIIKREMENISYPAIIDHGGSDTVEQIVDIVSPNGIQKARDYVRDNLDFLSQNSVIICVHPSKFLEDSIAFFEKQLKEPKHKGSRPPQGAFSSAREDLVNRLTNRHTTYLQNCDVPYFTRDKQANKGNRPQEIWDLFQRLEKERLGLAA